MTTGGCNRWHWPERVIIFYLVNAAEIGLFSGSSGDASKPEWSGRGGPGKRIVAAQRLKVKHKSVRYLLKWTICSLRESSAVAEPQVNVCV